MSADSSPIFRNEVLNTKRNNAVGVGREGMVAIRLWDGRGTAGPTGTTGRSEREHADSAAFVR